MRKLYLIITSIVLLLFLSISISPFNSKADALKKDFNQSNLFKPVVQIENERIDGEYFTNLNEHIDQLSKLDEGTIIIRFRYTGSNIMSLFSLSNSDKPDGHFHLYITPDSIGSENRLEKQGEPKENIHITSDDVNLEKGKVHTVAMVVNKELGYKYFLNGELILEDNDSPIKFLNNIYKPNSAQLGRTERPDGMNRYPFEGDIDFAEIYDEPLDDEVLLKLTKETHSEKKKNPLPDDALITDPYDVFYPGFMDSNNYRIPSLLYTQKGTLIAGIDRRIPHGGDSPNDIDSMVRRSLDNGQTWEDSGIIVNQYPDQASNIDTSLLQDEETGRIFLLVTSYPHNIGIWDGEKGSGFKEIDGEKYMLLSDEEGKKYTIREEGKVYDDEESVMTNYYVDSKRDLYKNGVKIDNIFSATSPLKPFMTSYLELYYSDDEGQTWSDPIDLNPSTKEEWMSFLGTAPGNGIQIKNGENKGRLVFPVYFLNDHNRQASTVIYSDDHGKTWHRGESPNEGRKIGDEIITEKNFTDPEHELTESQVVELPDGQLKLFMRNYSGYARVATSLDGGETWLPEVEIEKELVAPYSQMSAIRYDGQIDGKGAVIFSSAKDSSQRINGAIRVGLIEENGTYDNGRTKYNFNWKYEQSIKEGHYGYSSLTNLNDGNIGLLYEGTPDEEMSFITFNPSFLKWQKYQEPERPKIDSLKVENDAKLYQPGDRISVEVKFDDFVMMMGSKQLIATVDDKEVKLNLHEKISNSHYIFQGILPDLSFEQHELDFSFHQETDIFNVHGKTLDAQDESSLFKEKIHVGIPVKELSIDQTDLTLIEGKRGITLTATVTPTNATFDKLLWTSSDEKIATINDDGLVTPIKPGKVLITVQTSDGNHTDQITVTVKPDITELKELIEYAKSIHNKDGTYTKKSFNNLQSAIKEAESLLNSIDSKEELNKALNSIQDAINLLEKEEVSGPYEKEDKNDSRMGKRLPKTATFNHHWILLGLLFVFIGSVVVRQKKMN